MGCLCITGESRSVIHDNKMLAERAFYCFSFGFGALLTRIRRTRTVIKISVESAYISGLMPFRKVRDDKVIQGHRKGH